MKQLIKTATIGGVIGCVAGGMVLLAVERWVSNAVSAAVGRWPRETVPRHRRARGAEEMLSATMARFTEVR